MNGDNPLEFIDTDDLIDELDKRHDAFVTSSIRKSANADEEDLYKFTHSGSLHFCLGLAVDMAEELKMKLSMRKAQKGNK